MAVSVNNASNISNSDYSGRGVRENVSSGDSVSSKSVSSSSNSLQNGSTLTGEVIAKDGNQITLKLSGNQTIQAKLEGNADIHVGQKLTFEIARNGKQTALRPLFANVANGSAINGAIKAAGLPLNDITVAFTSQMMREGMPVNRNALSAMFKSVSTYPNASPESIVQMTKLGMPLTQNSVEQFDNYRNFENRIINDTVKISDGITEIFNEAVNSSDKPFNQNIVGEILNLIDTDGLETLGVPEDMKDMVRETVFETQVSDAESLDGTVDSIISESNNAVDSASGRLTQTISENGEVVYESSPETISSETSVEKGVGAPFGKLFSMINNAVDTIQEIVGGNVTQESEDTVVIKPNPELTLSPKEQQTLFDDLNQILEISGEDHGISEPLDGADFLKTVKELVKEYLSENVSDYSSQKVIEGAEQDPNNPDKKILPKEQQVHNEVSDRLKNMLKSDGFSKLLNEGLKAQFTVKPQNVADSSHINELYERIIRQSSKINDFMNNLGQGNSEISKAAANLTDNVNFMNQLNEFVNYVQLPMRMNGEETHGELYVYTKKKNMNNPEGNYSALLHLDMDYLGPMDVYVTMRNHTKVNTNFYLQSVELLDFVESHIGELTKRLNEKGYNTSTSVSKKLNGKVDTPITDEFFKDEPDENGMDANVAVAKMSFDVRA